MPEIAKGAIALEFAGFWRRFGAWIIDILGLGIILSFFEPLHASIFTPILVSIIHDSADWASKLEIITSPGAIVVFGIYFAGSWVWRGQTLGMMMAGVKIIRIDGTQIDTGRAIVRYLGFLISIIPFFLGFIWIAFDAHKQGWHDKLAETYVVKIPVVPEASTVTPPTAAA